MKKYLLLAALLPLLVTAQSTQRIEADNILLQTRTPQISNTNVTVNGSIKITAVANGSSTDSVLVVANGTLKRIARSAFSEFVSKTNADTITAFKWFTRKVILDSMYGTIYNGILNNALVKYNIGFVRPEGGTVTSYLAASTSSFGGPRNYHLPSRYANDTLLCQGDSNLYATKSDIAPLATTSSVNSALGLKLNIRDTANIRPQLVAGSSISLSGTYPNITVSATASTVGTYAQMLAIATPSEGQQFICSDYIPGLWVYTSFGAQWQCQVPPLVNTYAGLENTSGLAVLTKVSSGTGASTSFVLNDNQATIGAVADYSTGTTSTGSTALNFNPFGTGLGFRYGYNSAQACVFRCRVKLNQLSDATNSFFSCLGARSPTGKENICTFLYSHDLNGGNWTARTRGTSAIPANDINTNIAADLNWHEFVIMVNNTSARFYIDGILVATSTTSLPNIGSTVGAAIDGLTIIKRAGTTSVSHRVDYFKVYNYNRN